MASKPDETINSYITDMLALEQQLQKAIGSQIVSPANYRDAVVRAVA